MGIFVVIAAQWRAVLVGYIEIEFGAVFSAIGDAAVEPLLIVLGALTFLKNICNHSDRRLLPLR